MTDDSKPGQFWQEPVAVPADSAWQPMGTIGITGGERAFTAVELVVPKPRHRVAFLKNGKEAVVVDLDFGTVEIAQGIAWSEAALVFWRAVAQMAPGAVPRWIIEQKPAEG